jgi:tRNA G18 (ribose-2'-O)-methylase SpoU
MNSIAYLFTNLQFIALFSDLYLMKTENSKGGYCAIGVYQGKTHHNLGTLWRSAYILGAAYIFTIDGRYKKQSSDVVRAWSRIPLFNYKQFDDFLKSIPYDCRLVGVELDDKAEFLHEFQHPKRAIYLLGAEDSGLPDFVLEKCHMLIKLPGNSSLNVGVTGSIVLHDRASKVPTDFPPLHTES